MMIVFLKSISRPSPSSIIAFVEDLEEQLQHVGMRLFDFIEQHHGIRPAAHGFGENSAFAVADIAGRRALQRRDGMRFLKLRHVDGDQVVLAAIEQVGERQRGFGLADAAGADQQEDADGLVGIVQAGARGANALGDLQQGVILADDAAPRCSSSSSTMAISSFSILPTGMPVQPEITSPTICASTQTRISGVSPCMTSSSVLSSAQFGCGVGAFAVAAQLRRRVALRAWCADSRICITRSRVPFLNASFNVCELFLGRGFLLGDVCQALRMVGAHGGFASRTRVCTARSSSVARGVFDRGGMEFWPSESRAQAVSRTLTALSGKLAAGQIAMR